MNKEQLAEKAFENETVRKVLSSNGYEILVDSIDYDYVSKFTWWVHKREFGIANIRRWAKVNGRGINIILSRELLQAPKGVFVDHINRNPLDNRRTNLRLASPGENSRNRKKSLNKKCKYKGVYPNNRGKPWRVSIRLNGKHIHVGCFDTQEEGALAYNEASRKYHGEFGCINEEIEAALKEMDNE